MIADLGLCALVTLIACGFLVTPVCLVAFVSQFFKASRALKLGRFREEVAELRLTIEQTQSEGESRELQRRLRRAARKVRGIERYLLTPWYRIVYYWVRIVLILAGMASAAFMYRFPPVSWPGAFFFVNQLLEQPKLNCSRTKQTNY